MSNFMIFGGHHESEKIRPFRHHFSAGQNWFLDLTYQISQDQVVNAFSSQNACTY